MSKNSNYFSLASLLSYATVLRVLLLVFSIWQDKTKWPDGKMRFTDIDYDVFTDAALSIIPKDHNASSLFRVDLSQMYIKRPTYRYSPIIGLLVLPGYYLSNIFPDKSHIKNIIDAGAPLIGKIIFILFDLLCGFYQIKLMKSYPSTTNWENFKVYLISLGWLFNPITMTVSVRGNAEPFICFFVLLTLNFLYSQNLVLAGLCYGFSIHLKMYPVIYGLAIYFYLSTKCNKNSYGYYVLIPNKSHIIFGVSALFSLMSSTLLFYVYAGGMLFLNKAYLYHFSRVDIKHNFSAYFYPMYLFQSYDFSKVNGIIDIPRLKSIPIFKNMSSFLSFLSFVPNLILIPYFSYKFKNHPSQNFFILTFIFVTFNKVCTSQYFLWILCLVPPAFSLHHLWSSTKQVRKTVWLFSICAFFWIIGQSLWLKFAYNLEFLGEMGDWIWIKLWLSSLLFMVINTAIIKRISVQMLNCIPKSMKED